MVRLSIEDREKFHMQKSSPAIVTTNIPRDFSSMGTNEGLQILMTFDDYWMTLGPLLFLEFLRV